MTTKEKALEIIAKKGKLTTKDIISSCGISRQAANLVVNALVKEGRIKRTQIMPAIYVLSHQKDLLKLKISKRLRNDSLKEHEILDSIKKQMPLLFELSENIESIIDYAFSEILNNAIEHSTSNFIKIEIEKNERSISFTVGDFGIGVFRSIMEKKNLRSSLEAIQDLLKGKTTTQPRAHSGEGIFFTSKIADIFILESFGDRLRIDNVVNDVFIEKLKSLSKGTKVFFSINKNSKKHLSDMFKKYQADATEPAFDKTEVKIKLFTLGTIYISRSQARRVLSGLEKFKSIIFDFDRVPTIGQAFADEIFRLFIQNNPKIKIQAINANEAVQFMIDRVKKINNLNEEKTAKLI
ncbi:MAG: DUF4325 domain-containing protein [bacterium]|nr:DUF4325 domain-containing protein [bacterium]